MKPLHRKIIVLLIALGLFAAIWDWLTPKPPVAETTRQKSVGKG